MRVAKALVYESFGKPVDVLKLIDKHIDDPGANEVQIQMEAAPIHPSDFGMIGGSYGTLKDLPAVAGREGVGRIISLGDQVSGFSVGDRVRLPAEAGTWQTLVNWKADNLFLLPKNVPLEIAAMAFINPPTAWRVLRDAHLNSDEWVVQNAANSAVGIHVIQMAKYLGLKTLNVVRRKELIEPLKELGGDAVVHEESGYEKQIADLTGGGRVKLALNSVGGESAIRLIKALSPGGTHVTFGGMSFETVRFPTRYLIFNEITLKGFWMDKWYRENSAARAQIMFDKIFHLMEDGIVNAMISDTFSLDAFKAAIDASAQPRLGKVLFMNTDV